MKLLEIIPALARIDSNFWNIMSEESIAVCAMHCIASDIVRKLNTKQKR